MQVCGLEWSPDDRELASGGNDNQLLVWGNHGVQPQLRFCEHNAAVKAISWSPHQHGLLASGGGTADRCIRFWNTVTGAAMNHVDTGAAAQLSCCAVPVQTKLPGHCWQLTEAAEAQSRKRTAQASELALGLTKSPNTQAARSATCPGART